MEIRTRVIVYGSSLHITGIAASLKADQSLEVMSVAPHSPTPRQSLAGLNPAVIIFDLGDPPASVDVTLLRQRPGILLIGVDPASDEILVLSGRPQPALSVSDLVHVIQQKQSSFQPFERRSTNVP